MTVVVTGAAGHVGNNLVRALVARGQEVRAMVYRDRRGLEGLAVEVVPGDVRDPASLRRAFAGAEVVYHAAGYVSIVSDEGPIVHAINVEGTRNVVEACLVAGVRRLVHLSSIHAYEKKPLSVPADESRPLVDSRGAPYDRSKAAGERIVRQAVEQGLDAVILNPTAILGPYDFKPSFLGEVLLSLAQHKLPALVTGGFDWVDVRDVAEAAVRAAERAPAGARYLISGHWARVRELAAVVQETTGTPSPWFICPLSLATIGAPFSTLFARLGGKRPLYTTVSLDALRSNRVISHEKATRELGYEPRAFRETIVDSLRWFAGADYLLKG